MRLYRLYNNVKVSVGGIEVSTPFFIIDGLLQNVILGRLYERMTRIKHNNRDDGSCYTTISDKKGNSAMFYLVSVGYCLQVRGLL